jgi:hypothetical protein
MCFGRLGQHTSGQLHIDWIAAPMLRPGGEVVSTIVAGAAPRGWAAAARAHSQQQQQPGLASDPASFGGGGLDQPASAGQGAGSSSSSSSGSSGGGGGGGQVLTIPRIIHQNFLGGKSELDAAALQPKSHFRKEWWASCQVGTVLPGCAESC